MTLYLLYHVKLRALWELLYSATQLFQLHYQTFSFGKQFLLPFLFGLLHHLGNGITVQNQISLKTSKKHCCQSMQECYLVTEIKDMEDFLWPEEDS